MSNTATIRKRLAEAIAQNGRTYREISLKLGHRDSYIQQYIKYGLPKRLSEIDRKKISLMLNIDEIELIDSELSNTTPIHNHLFEKDPIRENSADYKNIDILSSHTTTPKQDNIIGRMCLNINEFNNWGTNNLNNQSFIRLDGDYMYPTLPNNSLVLYDSSINTYTGDGIYVININGAIQIKRIQKCDTITVTLKSDNPLYQDVRAPLKKVKFLGKATFYLSGNTL